MFICKLSGPKYHTQALAGVPASFGNPTYREDVQYGVFDLNPPLIIVPLPHLEVVSGVGLPIAHLHNKSISSAAGKYQSFFAPPE